MRRKQLLAAMILLLLAFIWRMYTLAPDDQPALAQSEAGDERVSIKITRFKWISERPSGFARGPSALERWVAKWSPRAADILARHRAASVHPPEGTIWLEVEADLEVRGAITADEIDLRIEYGTYTVGPRGQGWRDAGPVKQLSADFILTRAVEPEALEIKVGEAWYRFPLR